MTDPLDWDCDVIYALRILSNYATQDLAKRLASKGVTVGVFAVRPGPSRPESELCLNNTT
jgi:hypothetical protein